MSKVLIVVDYQNDFVSGALGFDGADRLCKGIVDRINAYNKRNELVIFTADTHKSDYLEKQEGKRLPIEHCIENTEGWELYGEVRNAYKKDDMTVLFRKETFGSLELGNFLSKLNNVTEVELCGLVTNMCVISNAVIAKAALPEARIVINAGLCDSFSKEMHNAALDVMESMQMDIINR